eukprot:3030728-Rhodomonas_salina.2
MIGPGSSSCTAGDPLPGIVGSCPSPSWLSPGQTRTPASQGHSVTSPGRGMPSACSTVTVEE